MNFISKLYRTTRKGEVKETLKIDDNEEPLVISKTRMKFLEFEINVLAYILSREIKISVPLAGLSEISWEKISLQDLDKVETILFGNFENVEISPIVKPLISILRGLLETHVKLLNGKSMPFFVKLQTDDLQNLYFFNDEVIYSSKGRNEKQRRHSEYIPSENRSPNLSLSQRTPRNFSCFNQKIELPIKSRTNNFNSPTPRNAGLCQTPREKRCQKHLISENNTPRSELNRRNNFFFCESNTPRKNSKAGSNYSKNINKQIESIMAAKAILGLSINLPTTEQDIRRAYLKAAMRWHPDKLNSGNSDKPHEFFTAIQSAMEILLQNASKYGEV
ncbi:DnaJ domain-containing protein [Cryptosporidium felis]|nr:DnaJ domain-containing protein [Cryptosporidium felis]